MGMPFRTGVVQVELIWLLCNNPFWGKALSCCCTFSYSTFRTFPECMHVATHEEAASDEEGFWGTQKSGHGSNPHPLEQLRPWLGRRPPLRCQSYLS